MRLYLGVISAFLLAVDGGGAKADDQSATGVDNCRISATTILKVNGDRHEQ